jgi:hypothetical protein
MSNAITSNTASIESYRDADHNSAMARVMHAEGMSGCAMAIRLQNCGPFCGSFWVARHKSDTQNDYVLLLPAPRWEQDARDAGWELVTKLSSTKL